MAQSYIENRIERVKVLESTGDGAFRFEAVVSEADYINQNRRMYPERVLFPAFSKVTAEIERHPGTVDHPDPYGPVSVSDLGIAWESFWFEGSQVIGRGRIIPTAKGRDLQAAMEAEIAIGFSTRGRGLSEEQTIDGRTVNVLTDYELDTVDAVIDPSVGHARIRSFTKEETEKMDKELEQANEARQAAETQLAEAQTRIAELEGVAAERDELKTALEVANARIAEFEAADAARTELEAADAFKNRLVALTAEHRFGPAIRAEVEGMIEAGIAITLENVEAVVTRVQGLVESAAAAANEEQGEPRGDVSTNEDKEVEDPYTAEQRAELIAAGLL